MVVHLILHWDWVMCMVRGGDGERRSVKGIVAIIAVIVVLLVGIASLVTPVRTVSGRPDHEEHEEQLERGGGAGQGYSRGRSGGQ